MKVTTKYIFIGIAILLLSQIIYGAIIYYTFNDWQSRGTFGDMFGAVNALFSGLAFLGVVVTVIMQREEIGLQKQELELTRIELARSAKAQEESVLATQAQTNTNRETALLTTVSFLLEHYRRYHQILTKDNIGGIFDKQIDEVRNRISKL